MMRGALAVAGVVGLRSVHLGTSACGAQYLFVIVCGVK